MTQGGRPAVDEPWALESDELMRSLGTTPAGLSADQVRDRLRQHGANRLHGDERSPVLAAVVGQLRNPLLWLLAIAAGIGAAVGEGTNAAVVVAILLLGSSISILQEGRAGRTLARLRERVAPRSWVVRDGALVELPSTELVPGDILVLAAGTLIAADAVLYEAHDLFVAESALTGESFPAEKHVGPAPHGSTLADRVNVVHMGTNVRSGSGRAVIVQTGRHTQLGGLAHRLSLRPPETEFQHGLRRLGYMLLSMMLVLVVAVFAGSAVQGHRPTDALLFAIALAVGLAPEMLPAVLATMLSRGARRLAARGVLVRRLEAIENLGNMDVLCTDKTGTLTAGDVRLERAVDASGEDSGVVAKLAWWNAGLQAGIPNPLDRAIVESASARSDRLPAKLDEMPFDFTRRRLSVLVDDASTTQPLLVTKGAFESVLGVCTSFRRGETIAMLDAVALAELRERADDWSRDGVRVLALATRRTTGRSALSRDDERDMVLEGFLTFRDPIKPGAAEAIADLRALAVDVKIVSGDHHEVVRHLGAAIGLRAARVVTGTELATTHDDALWQLVEGVDLFAEVDPGQKERILLALRHTGHVVGFMGDGINDAPAMHIADVGISVEGAADVARAAADFVLLRRGLDTVRDGVVEGRTTFGNTLKYILTTESANLGNMISMAASSLFLPFLPLLASQVLLNNFLSDIPSTALSTDRVDPELLARPRRWDIRFIRRFMIAFGILSAAFDGITFLALRLVFDAGPELFRTAWFTVSLLTELLVLLALRTRRHIWASRPHPALWISTLAVVAVAVALPVSPLAPWLAFVPLPPAVWIAALGISVAYLATVESLKHMVLRWIERPGARPRRATPPLALH